MAAVPAQPRRSACTAARLFAHTAAHMVAGLFSARRAQPAQIAAHSALKDRDDVRAAGGSSAEMDAGPAVAETTGPATSFAGVCAKG